MFEELQRTAWKLNADGADWPAVAEELGCTAEAAELMARRYERDTDAVAAQGQFSLFDP